MKRELKGKIEKLVVYETEREYQGTFIDSNFVSGDCGAGGPGRVKEKRKKRVKGPNCCIVETVALPVIRNEFLIDSCR